MFFYWQLIRRTVETNYGPIRGELGINWTELTVETKIQNDNIDFAWTKIRNTVKEPESHMQSIFKSSFKKKLLMQMLPRQQRSKKIY